MRRAESSPASSGWAWGTAGPPGGFPPPHRPRRGAPMVGVWLAVGLLLAMVAGGVALVVTALRSDGSDEAEADADADVDTDAAEAASATPEAAPAAVASAGGRVEPTPPAAPEQPATPRSLDRITWTVATAATIDELVVAWSLPRDSLIALNPTLSPTDPIAAGTAVVVHAGPITGSESVGPPNDGRLLGAVPFPEGRTWLLAPDRTRAFGTGETVVAVLAALDAYAVAHPDAPPIQLGELSARRGGPIYGHQSHQAGRDIDIRLIVDAAANRFDPERNWALVKALVDGGEVVAIFLNRSQQGWLRAAAEADVGAAEADRYFELISHEPGHTIHIHVRFRCPDSDHRCVVYSIGEVEDDLAKRASKLPGGGKPLVRINGKLPTLRPKSPPVTPRKPARPTGKLPGTRTKPR